VSESIALSESPRTVVGPPTAPADHDSLTALNAAALKSARAGMLNRPTTWSARTGE
jgi:hypothetical protein